MMGHQAGAQERLFYSFNLEDPVPDDHLLRGIDRFLDLSHLHQHLAEFYSHTGRPSIDPELMIRTLIIGYCFGIRSERRLCEEVHLNLAYRGFCRLAGYRIIPVSRDGYAERVSFHSEPAQTWFTSARDIQGSPSISPGQTGLRGRLAKMPTETRLDSVMKRWLLTSLFVGRSDWN